MTSFDAQNTDPDVTAAFAEGVQDAQPEKSPEETPFPDDFNWQVTLNTDGTVSLVLGPKLSAATADIPAGGTLIVHEIGKALISIGHTFLASHVPGEEADLGLEQEPKGYVSEDEEYKGE